MPRLNGNGPLGQGPMTGKACGYCILRNSKENSKQTDGFKGIGGKPVSRGDSALEALLSLSADSHGKTHQEKDLLQEQLQILKRKEHQVEQRLNKMKVEHRPVAVVLHEKCGGCGICEEVCPENAIKVSTQTSVNRDICISCGRCASECPNEAIILAPERFR